MAMLGKLRRRRFDEILVSDGLIGQDQLDEALEIQKGCGDTLGAILLDIGYIVEGDIVKALSIQYQLPCLHPDNYEIDTNLFDPFDPAFLHRHLILPIDRIGNLMLVLLHNIPSKSVIEEMQQITSCDLAIYLGTSSEIKNALVEHCAISAADEAEIRASRISSEPTQEARVNTVEKDLSSLETMDLSSENLLSSLDEAWDSIFVELGENDKGDGR